MKRQLAIVLVVLGMFHAWLLTTNHPRVWPVRNTLQYEAYRTVGLHRGIPPRPGAGTLSGTIITPNHDLVAGARVLVARRDGTTWSTRSGPDGTFLIKDIPPGKYFPIADAPGYGSALLGGHWGGVEILPGAAVSTQVVLPFETRRAVAPGRQLTLSDPTTLECSAPLASRATRHEVRFLRAGRPNQLTYLYLPTTATAKSDIPTLLAVYPSPLHEWECVNIPLAAANHAVLAIAPAYSLDLEQDVDELVQLLGFLRAGRFPGTDAARVAVLGGSYSGLHVQRLVERDSDLDAVVLLGAPSDLFDMRRRYEAGSFIPPFGLDKALIALGFPDEEIVRYWSYSGAYHVRPDMPPVALFHSRNDDIVPYQQSERLATFLAEEGVEHELHLFDGGTHYLLSTDEDALEIYDLTLDFLARHLPPSRARAATP